MAFRSLPVFASRLLPRAASQWQPQAARFSVSARAALRKYSKDHEWVDIDGRTATVGISNFAAGALGDVVFVDLPKPGQTVTQGDPMGAVESVKSAADINSPISGNVSDINSRLEETPAIVNKLPEDDGPDGGWIARVEVSDALQAELDNLMTDEEYASFVDGQSKKDDE